MPAPSSESQSTASAPLLPRKDVTIQASSAVKHRKLLRSLQSMNGPADFVFHTHRDDTDPEVVIDFQRPIAVPQIFLYNRQMTDQMARELVGVSLETSVDGVAWNMHPLVDEAVVEGGDPIILGVSPETRYLRLRKPTGGVIHLSQITLGAPKKKERGLIDIFAEEHGLSPAPDGAFRENPNVGRPQHLLSVTGPSLERGPLQIRTLSFNHFGRFSNSLLALAHAHDLAGRLGASTVVIPHDAVADPAGTEILFEGAEARENARVLRTGQGIDLVLGDAPPAEGHTLHGSFFYTQQKSLYPGQRGAYKDTKKIRPWLSVAQRVDPLPERDVVVHIRSGDVFAADTKVHPGYGQPPLSYYTRILEEEGFKKVWIVFEDRANPVVDALEAYLKKVGVDYAIQNASLREDIKLILAARNVIFGFGTFVPVILAMSHNVRKAYTMERFIGRHLPPDVRVATLQDRGPYTANVLSQNWANTPEQRQMMLDYNGAFFDIDVEIT